jgi:hypothetical protein
LSSDVRNQDRAAGELGLCLAAAAAGVALGVFAVAVLALLYRHTMWRVLAYEPIAAFFGALGVALFAARRTRREGIIGMAAACAAMLAGDICSILSRALMLDDWMFVCDQLGWMFHWSNWPKLIRYGFGIYLAWFLCAGGRSTDKDHAE